MKTKKSKQSLHFGLEEYIQANRKISREIELERNGHWIAVNRPHKNKKKYDRKRDRRVDTDGLFNFIKDDFIMKLNHLH